MFKSVDDGGHVFSGSTDAHAGGDERQSPGGQRGGNPRADNLAARAGGGSQQFGTDRRKGGSTTATESPRHAPPHVSNGARATSSSLKPPTMPPPPPPPPSKSPPPSPTVAAAAAGKDGEGTEPRRVRFDRGTDADGAYKEEGRGGRLVRPKVARRFPPTPHMPAPPPPPPTPQASTPPPSQLLSQPPPSPSSTSPQLSATTTFLHPVPMRLPTQTSTFLQRPPSDATCAARNAAKRPGRDHRLQTGHARAMVPPPRMASPRPLGSIAASHLAAPGMPRVLWSLGTTRCTPQQSSRRRSRRRRT